MGGNHEVMQPAAAAGICVAGAVLPTCSLLPAKELIERERAGSYGSIIVPVMS